MGERIGRPEPDGEAMTEPSIYATKHVEVEAWQWDGTMTGAVAIQAWIEHSGRQATIRVGPQQPPVLFIETDEGRMEAKPKDYIIRGTRGEFYPCKPDPFADKYERVTEAQA